MLSAESLLSGTPSSGNAASALQERDRVQGLLTAAQDGNDLQLAERAKYFEGQPIESIKDGQGRNALHFAAQNGRVKACQYLLEALHADPNARAEEGDTPLGLAAAAGQLDICKVLQAHGAALSPAEGLQPQPIHRAAASGHKGVVHWFLDHGTPVDAPSTAGTPLLWASGSGQADVVEALLQAGANPDATAADGVSAILMASAAGSSAAVEKLIQAGADVDAVAAGGVTALHTAAECGSIDTVRALLQAGADANAKDEQGHRPLDAAAGEGDRDMMKLLKPKTVPYISDWTLDGLLAHSKTAVHAQGEDESHQEVAIPAASEPDEAAAAQHKRLGDEAFVRKDFAAAAAAYTQSLQHSTSNHVPWANRSAAYLQMQQPERAWEDARLSRTICPSYAKAWYREGCAAAKMHRWEDAANAFFSGYQAEPSNKLLAQAFQDAVQQGREQHQKSQ